MLKNLQTPHTVWKHFQVTLHFKTTKLNIFLESTFKLYVTKPNEQNWTNGSDVPLIDSNNQKQISFHKILKNRKQKLIYLTEKMHPKTVGFQPKIWIILMRMTFKITKQHKKIYTETKISWFFQLILIYVEFFRRAFMKKKWFWIFFNSKRLGILLHSLCTNVEQSY